MNSCLYLLSAYLLIFTSAVFAKPVLPIQHWQTKNGVKVYFVQVKQLPMLDISVLFDAGSAHDEQQYGLASLTNGLLEYGADNLTADQIAEGFDNIGAQFNSDANQDFALVTLRCLTKKTLLEPAINLFDKIVTRPTFPKKEFERLKQQTLIALEQQKQQPPSLGMRAFYKELYRDHPYAHIPLGTTEAVKTITRKNVAQFYKKYYVAANAKLILVGAINKHEAEIIANNIANGLAAGEEARKIPPAKSNTKEITKNISFPGTQSYVYFGCTGINYDDPTYYPLLVGNHILGGGALVSRLFHDVRQKHGLSYSIKSIFKILKARGPFAVSLQTKNQSLDKASQIAKETLQKFVAFGATPKELADAKKYLIGNFTLQFDSNAKISGALITLASYNLPLDYFDKYIQKINAVTVEQVKQAFQELIGQQKLVTVVVGG